MTIKHLYPTQRPSLDLNFARTKRLDPRVTFTRGSTATYVGNDGLIKYAAANEARFDHDPVTGESLGLLIEESRTNVSFLGSTTLINATRTLGTGVIGPEGNDNGVYFADDNLNTTANNGHYLRTSKNDLGITVTNSVYVKKSGSTKYIGVGFQYGGSMGLCTFDLDTGDLIRTTTAGAYPVVLGSSQALNNGWFRFSVTATFDNNNPAVRQPVIVFIPEAELSQVPISGQNFTGPRYTGTGSEQVYLYGMQTEVGSFPTSYIQTTSSTNVTRAADVASLTNTNVYDTDSFTILNNPYGAAAGGSTLNIVGGGQTPVKRTTVYNQELSQSQINTLVKKDDEFWRWRILGSSFALPDFLTDGQVTVDWGDGTVEIMTTSEHTFSDGGGYHDVGFRLDSGTYFRPYINNNATHKDKVIALGPAPESMKASVRRGLYGCSALKAFDATVDATGEPFYEAAWSNCSSLTSFPFINTTGVTAFNLAWRDCSNLTSFPLLDASSVTTFQGAWQRCSSLTSFPLIDTSSGTGFTDAWNDCSSLTSFPLIDTSSGTNFQRAWQDCSSLTSFPLIDTSSATGFPQAWNGCSSLTSFPLIDTSSGTNFRNTWQGCSSLTNFPLIDISSGTVFLSAWRNCSSLTDFPANFFDSWTGTPANTCFVNAWDGCSSLTATSVENILNSIDTSGQSAPASDVDITIDYDTGTGTPSVSTAVTNLKSRGWTITLNGVAQ